MINLFLASLLAAPLMGSVMFPKDSLKTSEKEYWIAISGSASSYGTDWYWSAGHSSREEAMKGILEECQDQCGAISLYSSLVAPYVHVTMVRSRYHNGILIGTGENPGLAAFPTMFECLNMLSPYYPGACLYGGTLRNIPYPAWNHGDLEREEEIGEFFVDFQIPLVFDPEVEPRPFSHDE